MIEKIYKITYNYHLQSYTGIVQECVHIDPCYASITSFRYFMTVCDVKLILMGSQ